MDVNATPSTETTGGAAAPQDPGAAGGGCLAAARDLDKIPPVLKDRPEPSRRLSLSPDLARKFLETIFSSYLKETAKPSYIEVRGKRQSDVKMSFRRFYLGIDLLVKDMDTWPADRHYWFGIAPRWSDTKGTKGECLGLTVVFVDVDYGSAGHKKKNRWKTRDEAQAAIDAFPIKPSIVVHTGGGFQVYWILSAPFIFENGNYGQVEAIMKGIGAAIGGDDGTQDASRIFRIPGTFNVKTDELRPVEMISCDPVLVYDLADFAHYPAPAPALDQAPPQDGPQTTNRDVLKSPEFKKMPAWLREIIVSGNAAAYNDDRSKRDHAVIGTLKRAGCNLNIIESIFRHHPVGDRYREEQQKKRGGRAYLQLSFDKAGGDTRPGTAAVDSATGITDTELLNYARASQVGDARLFIRLFADQFLYDHAAGKWYQWGGHYWLDDEVENVLMALDRLMDMYHAAALRAAWEKAAAIKSGNTDAAKEPAAREDLFFKKVGHLQKKNWRLDVLVFAAAGDGSLGITGREWDQSTMLVACPNGVLDLEKRKFRPGLPDDFIKVACPTEWKGKDEPAPEWEKFLLEIFNGDVELANYFRRLAGYSISGQRIERVLPIPWGIGWNGKGTTFETLEHILGDLAGPVPAELLLEDGKNYRSGGAPTPEIMRLRGKRLVWASETNEGRKLNPGKVKWLTGGDTLVGRDPFGKKLVSFPPTHVLFLMTNHKPKANADDFALWQRINLIPFELSFVDNPKEPHERKRDKHIVDRLKKEAPGILAWLVRGFFEYKIYGLNPPVKVTDATAKYRETEDTIGQFIAEECVVHETAKVKASELYRKYEDWCKENGHKPVWGNTFGEKIAVKFHKKHTKRGVYYFGMDIRSSEEKG